MRKAQLIAFLILSCIVLCNGKDDSYCMTNEQTQQQECFSYDSIKQGKGQTLPKYVVNLDLSYQDRWRDLITKYKSPIQNMFKFIETYDKVQQLKKQVPLFKDTEFLNELQAIATLAESDFGTVQIASQMYETLTVIGCTSILARDWTNKIIHARNLDYDFEKLISPALASIDFQKGGKTVFLADMIIGTAFVVTGVVPNGFSITINQRDDYDDGQSTQFLIKQYYPAPYLIYHVLQTITTFDDAVKALSTTKIAMPAYLNVAGISDNQGIVIQRDRDGVNMTSTLSASVWYLCQTNHDRQEEDPKDDYRRVPCENKLQKLNPNTFSYNDIYNILAEKPNFVDSTITTDIMIPKSGYLNSTKWFVSTSFQTHLMVVCGFLYSLILL